MAALCMALMPVPALAGPPSDAVRAVQAAAGVAALAPGAIRFTAIRPKGGGATVYEARTDGGGATRTITDLSSDKGVWSVDNRETKPVAAETIDYFTGRIDAAIAAAPADAACADPADFYAEHGSAGVAGGGCAGDHPNAAIARALGLADPVAP